MSTPNSKATLKDYCLRRLGHPVVEINVDDDQVDDRIDDALAYYRDYHYDGTERDFLKHQVTATDITNGYISIPANISGIINVFPVGVGLNVNNMFNIRYQITLNDVYDWSKSAFSSYVSTMENIALLQEIFVGKQSLRFSRHTDRLHIDMNWSERVQVGEFLLVECYRVLDPDTFTSVWGDWWLRQYTTQLIKRQWGENLKKFEGMQMPGGLTFNGQKIWEEATEEQRNLEAEVLNSYSLPVMDMEG